LRLTSFTLQSPKDEGYFTQHSILLTNNNVRASADRPHMRSRIYWYETLLSSTFLPFCSK
jgi:hypothetical protein